jgi:hypothetical protein
MCNKIKLGTMISNTRRKKWAGIEDFLGAQFLPALWSRRLAVTEEAVSASPKEPLSP